MDRSIAGGLALRPLRRHGGERPVTITEVRAWVPRSPRTPAGWRGSMGQIAVAVDTDAGLRGYGVGGGGDAGVHVVRAVLRDLLLGRDPAPVERLWQEMYAATLPFGRKGLAIMALSGVDLALWDLRGKAAAAPVAALLGGTTGTAVPCYLTLGRLPSAGSGTGGARREEVAPGRPRRPSPEALRRGYAAVKLGLGAVPAPAGEWRPAAGFHALLKMGAHHVLQPDVCWCGGMTVLRRIYELAAARGVPVRPHRGAEAWALHAICALDPDPLAESPRPWLTWVRGAPQIRHGVVTVGDAAGFGVTCDDAPP